MSEILLSKELEPRLPIVHNQSVYLQTPPSYPKRFQVPDHMSDWGVECEDYDPVYHVDDHVLESIGTWAEPEPGTIEELLDKGLNPHGRTGIAGRGLLGKWEVNPTRDAVVTRRSESGTLELLTINRGDSGELALPGGFADEGETKRRGAAREVSEETTVDLPEAAGVLICSDYYIYSARTTDHAWIETTAFHWHLEGEESLQVPVASDDAIDARWLPVNQDTMRALLQSHGLIVEAALATF